MLNRNSKKFLRFLRKSTPDYDDQVYTYNFIEKNYHLPLEKVFATVRYLEKMGYLEIAKTSGSGTHFGVILTEMALHPYEFLIVEIRSFLFKSICTPILVSLFTTLLTLWLTWLASQ